VLKKKTEPWRVTLIDTGEFSNTGERIRRIQEYVNDDFCLTYGDGLTSANIKDVIKFHKNNNKLATVLAVKPIGRFGAINIKGDIVDNFLEKPSGDGGWINGGFFVLNKKIFKYLEKKNLIWEKEPLEKIAKNKQLSAFKFSGFWHAMDTLRDKNYLDNLWASNNAPWKSWNE
jgi:glucose-1-phosphate cytidylyltransferase